MVVAPLSPPAPTPAPTLPSAYGLVQHLQPRQTDFYGYSYDADCYVRDVLLNPSQVTRLTMPARTIPRAYTARPSSTAATMTSSPPPTTTTL
jgi:hypothetical protein